MKKYIEIELSDDEKIYIEAYNADNSPNELEGDFGIKNISNSKEVTFLEKGQKFLDTSLNTIGKYSKKVMDTLKSKQYNLDEIEVEFSAGIDFKGNVIIASTKSDLGMKLKLKWKNKEEKNS